MLFCQKHYLRKHTIRYNTKL